MTNSVPGETATEVPEGQAPFDGADPFDPAYTREILGNAFELLADCYFRPRVLGADRLPKRGPLIVAPNHSGTAFPYDGMMLDSLLWQREGMQPDHKLRSVFEKELARTWWMRPFGIDNFWRRCGGVDLSFDNFDRLLARGDRVIYYPEGVAGIGKGFYRRYQLQPFHTSFVKLAAKHDVPVVPIYIVNAEWVIPFNFTLRPIDWLVQKMWRVPFLPLPGAILAILFPFAWWLALPARMILVVGEAIDVAGMVREAGAADPEHASRATMEAVADRVRRLMQPRLTEYVQRYGQRPYDRRSLWKGLRKAYAAGRLLRALPFGWVVHFLQFERDRQRGPARNRLHRWLRDWDLIGYYLPLGWPLISLTRRFRRPPCGYGGLSASERRKRSGEYFWRLADRPLPGRNTQD